VPTEQRAFLAEGHNQALDRVSPWDLPSMAGAGALRSPMNEMLRFLAAKLSNTPPVHPMLHRVSISENQIGDLSLAVALGWMVMRDPVGDIVWHNGGTGGFRSFIGFNKKAGVGVVVLSNSADDVDDLGLNLLLRGFPLQPAASVAQPMTWLTLLPFGLVLWLARRRPAARPNQKPIPNEPASAGWRRWGRPKPLGSKFEVWHEVVDCAAAVALFYHIGVWQFWGTPFRTVLILAWLASTVVVVGRCRGLARWPSFRPGRWIAKGLGVLGSVLVLVFALFSM